VLHTTQFDHSAFAARGAELRFFAQKTFQTVENDREKFREPLIVD
jgi:hypothetical protein